MSNWYDEMKKAIDSLPQMEIVPKEEKRGRWICADDFYESGVCSVCKWNSGEPHGICIKEWHYCPNCGARMEDE